MRKEQVEQLKKRNKPLNRIGFMFLVMFLALTANILYFTLVSGPNLMMNTYNPRLEDLESKVIRGSILDRNGDVIVESIITKQGQERHYLYDDAFAHVIGGVKPLKTGIEAYSNMTLITAEGTIFERFKQSMTNNIPKGNSVETTLDIQLQLLATELLKGHKGAIVALEPSTGEVLAMVSAPAYNPNDLEEIYDDISKDNDDALLLNRATQGLYPPGSTYKVVTTMAYLENNKEEDFFYYCLGEEIIGQRRIHCYNSTAHGRLTLSEAFAKSCNTSFATIGQDIEADRLREISQSLGYNSVLNMEIPTKMSRFVLDRNSSGPEISETAIGQGKTIVTPINNAMIAAMIANDGVMNHPSIIKNPITNSIGEVVSVERKVNEKGIIEEVNIDDHLSKRVISTEMAELLEKYMVLTSEEGTAKGLKNDQYKIASKTGSAENPFGDTHAWYIGYAPVKNPQIALAIVIENVGSSSSNAVPMAKELYNSYIK